MVAVVAISVAACSEQRSSAPGERESSTAEGRWTLAPAPPKTVAGFQGLSAFAVAGEVAVIAEVDYEQATVKIITYDPEDQDWAGGADSEIWWRSGSATVSTDDEVILHGGCCGPAGSGSRAPGFAYDVQRDRWREIAAGPLGDRFGHAAVWTGRQAIFWGGFGASRWSDGAAYEPKADTWDRIATGPLGPRRDHVAVWTGEEMIIWGGSNRSLSRSYRGGAAYDVDADRWRPITQAPIPPQIGPELEADATDAVWTGREMLIWNGAEGAAYEPIEDSWRRIPHRPLPPGDPGGTDSAVWTGEELIVWGGVRRGVDFLATGAAYDPDTDRWQLLPESPLEGRDRHAAAWTGDAMLIWGGCCHGSRYFSDGAFFVPK